MLCFISLLVFENYRELYSQIIINFIFFPNTKQNNTHYDFQK